jgi:hypothetical protein
MQRKSIIKFYTIIACYFVFCAVSNECLIISCGAWLSANGLTSSSCLYSCTYRVRIVEYIYREPLISNVLNMSLQSSL